MKRLTRKCRHKGIIVLEQNTDSELVATDVEPLYGRIHAILTAARTNVARSVNTEMVRAYWLVGREIVEEEQAGQARAAYGGDVIAQISARLQAAFGKGFTVTNVKYMRLFYLAYPKLLDGEQIRHAVRDELASPLWDQMSAGCRGRSARASHRPTPGRLATSTRPTRDFFRANRFNRKCLSDLKQQAG